MYDPIQSRKSGLVLKAFRLSDAYMQMRRSKQNTFIKPEEILEELPVKIKNCGHVAAFIRCLQDSHKDELDCDFEPLAMNDGDSYTQRHLEMIRDWLDDFVPEQHRLWSHAKLIAKARKEQIRWFEKKKKENEERLDNGEDPVQISLSGSGLRPLSEAPPRLEHLLTMGQLDKYCKQMNQHVDSSFHKLFVTSQLHST